MGQGKQNKRESEGDTGNKRGGAEGDARVIGKRGMGGERCKRHWERDTGSPRDMGRNVGNDKNRWREGQNIRHRNPIE